MMTQERRDELQAAIDRGLAILRTRVYLGDGLYAEHDGYQCTLAANNGIHDTNTVYLDNSVTKSFIDYISKINQVIHGLNEVQVVLIAEEAADNAALRLDTAEEGPLDHGADS